MGEPGLGLLGTDLGLVGGAPHAASAPVDERDGDAIADGEGCDLRADTGDDTGELVTRAVGQGHRVVAAPGVPVRPAYRLPGQRPQPRPPGSPVQALW